MPVTARKVQEISQASNPKLAIINAVGDLSKVEVMFDLVLVGVYIRPEKTAGGIIRPDSNVGEDEWQGICGLVLKKGPTAFMDDEYTQYSGQDIAVGDWVVFNVGDAKSIQFNGTPCRYLKATQIRMKIPNPEMVF